MLKLINTINESMFDIKKSGNPKIYIEMLLIKFINTNFSHIQDDEVLINKELSAKYGLNIGVFIGYY